MMIAAEKDKKFDPYKSISSDCRKCKLYITFGGCCEGRYAAIPCVIFEETTKEAHRSEAE